MTLEQRLEKLERELADTRAELGRAMREVRANSFVLVDANGKVRAQMTVDKDGPALKLLDEKGKLRAQMTVDKDGPRLTLADENEKPRAELHMDKDGPGLGLCDENGKVIWQAPQ